MFGASAASGRAEIYIDLVGSCAALPAKQSAKEAQEATPTPEKRRMSQNHD